MFGDEMFVATITVVQQNGGRKAVVSVRIDDVGETYVERFYDLTLLPLPQGVVRTFLNALLDWGVLSDMHGTVDITAYTSWASLASRTPFGLQVIRVGEGKVVA
jgi:hypothetical protein